MKHRPAYGPDLEAARREPYRSIVGRALAGDPPSVPARLYELLPPEDALSAPPVRFIGDGRVGPATPASCPGLDVVEGRSTGSGSRGRSSHRSQHQAPRPAALPERLPEENWGALRTGPPGPLLRPAPAGSGPACPADALVSAAAPAPARPPRAPSAPGDSDPGGRAGDLDALGDRARAADDHRRQRGCRHRHLEGTPSKPSTCLRLHAAGNLGALLVGKGSRGTLSTRARGGWPTPLYGGLLGVEGPCVRRRPQG